MHILVNNARGEELTDGLTSHQLSMRSFLFPDFTATSRITFVGIIINYQKFELNNNDYVCPLSFQHLHAPTIVSDRKSCARVRLLSLRA